MKPEIDLAAAVTYATADPDWVRKALVAGLYFCIPFVGPFVLLGWQKRLVGQALTSPEIPAIEIGPDLVEGLRVFLGLLITTAPAIVVMLAIQCAAFVPAAALGRIENEGASAAIGVVTALVTLIGTGLFMLLILAYQLLMPDLLRRIFRGETAPVLSLGRSFEAIRRSPTPYVVAFVGIMLAQLVGSLGVFACFVGMIFTYPLSLLILSHVLAQWDRIAESATIGLDTQP